MLCFTVLVALEILTVFGLVIYVLFYDWSFHSLGLLVAIMWCLVAVVSASLLPVVAMARPLAATLDHKLILLQLRTTKRCVIFAHAVSIAVGLAAIAVLGLDWWIIRVSMFMYCVLAMLAAGHAMVSLAHVAHAVNEKQ